MDTLKKNTILAAVTGVVFILAFLANDPFLIFEKSYEKSKPLLPGRPERVKKIVALNINGQEKRTFARTSDGWSVELAGSPLGVLRADSSKVETGLKNLFEARRYQEVSSNKDSYGEYEVRDSDLQLLLEGENGEKIAQVILGKYSGAGNASFIRLADEDSVYAVKGFLRGDWNQEFDQYRDRTLLRLARENVREIKVEGKSNFTLKSDDKGNFNLEPPRATDKNKVNTFLSDLLELTGTRFAKDKEALPVAKWGKITLVLTSNVSKEVEIIGPNNNSEMFAKSTDLPHWVTIAKSKAEALFPKLDDLLEKTPLPDLKKPGK
ncbi:MAG: DUF4340 domain-containing protein [Turneriella sp.]|nr:DUF4340 domain-containing protein [Leptospiraceae bacterium]MCX7632651.1 DUF4340 domain-containing protein [Turneriella sp.]